MIIKARNLLRVCIHS